MTLLDAQVVGRKRGEGPNNLPQHSRPDPPRNLSNFLDPFFMHSTSLQNLPQPSTTPLHIPPHNLYCPIKQQVSNYDQLNEEGNNINPLTIFKNGYKIHGSGNSALAYPLPSIRHK